MPDLHVKDPHSVLDWVVLWAGWLESAGADEIADVDFFTDDDAMLIESMSHTESAATVWLSGGTPNRKATVTCRITTSAGRTEDLSFTISIKEKKV